MKLRKIFVRSVPFLLAALIFALAFSPASPKEEETERRVVRVWNVDTFEGGTGSRTNFLKSVARETERTREGVFYLVSSYTAEGAAAAFAEGDLPDLLSFGVGLSAFAEVSLPLPYAFAGGELGGECLAYPWCRGGYALFSRSEDFSEAGATAISCGGSNLPSVAAALSGIEGETLPSLEAYTAFLGGKYRYLLGTQRDLCRFRARNADVCFRPLDGFCDLYQYISVLSSLRWEDCLAFLEVLLGEKTQSRLASLGMYPVRGEGELPQSKRTIGVFASEACLAELRNAAGADAAKKAEKYLKTI